MKKSHAIWASLVLGTGFVPIAVAQTGIPANAAGAAGAVTSAAPAAAPQTLWSWLGCSWEQKEECRRALCKMPIGQMLNNATLPMGMISGGLIPQFCPTTPTAEQLKDEGAVGAAAKIKADEAAAKERRAAVRYLGTVDCHYWPEAQDALIDSLRKDRNECVRFEAALALGSGCCCTKKTIEALIIASSCSDRDGNPRETSARVQSAARIALDKCLACFEDLKPVPKTENLQEKPKEEKKGTTEKAGEKTSSAEPRKLDEGNRPSGKAYYARIADVPMAAIVKEGRRVLAATPAALPPVSASGNSLARLLDRASGVPQTRGYIIQGNQPSQAEVVAAKPTNLWELMTGRNQPVVVTSVPASVMSPSERVVPQAAVPAMNAHVAPLPQAAPLPPAAPMPTALAAGQLGSSNGAVRPATPAPATMPMNSNVMAMPPVQSTPREALPPVPAVQPPALPVVQPPALPVASPSYRTSSETRITSPTPAPLQPAKVTPPAPAVQTTPTVRKQPEARPVTIQPVQSTMPATPPAATPVSTPVKVVTPAPVPVQAAEAPKVEARPGPAMTPLQAAMQKMAMGTVEERLMALESLTAHKGSTELATQLIKTAEQDSNEHVRCAAIRAMVRTSVHAGRAIPVLSHLGMDLETSVGKEANNALAQINLQLVQDQK